jgi:hypothetical protein
MKWKDMFNFSSSGKDRFKNIFPNICPECGEKYCNTDDFFAKTDDISSAVLESDSGNPVKIKINCRCRSCEHIFTFIIDERRDLSKHGCYIRNKFGQMLEMLVDEGMNREDARKEMLKLFHEQERTCSIKKK